MALDRHKMNALLQQASSPDDRGLRDEAFGALAAGVQDELFRLCLANGLSQDDAIEATQETFLRAYRRIATWQPGSDAMNWLCGIALNVVRERHRQERRRHGEATLWVDNPSESAGELSVYATGHEEPWEWEQLQQLRAAIEALPPRQREAVVCRYLRRMSIRDTAAAMGCAEGTIKSAVSAALEALREVLVRRR